MMGKYLFLLFALSFLTQDAFAQKTWRQFQKIQRQSPEIFEWTQELNRQQKRQIRSEMTRLDRGLGLSSFQRPEQSWYPHHKRDELYLRFVSYSWWQELNRGFSWRMRDNKPELINYFYSYQKNFRHHHGPFFWKLIEHPELARKAFSESTSGEELIFSLTKWLRDHIAHNSGQDNPDSFSEIFSLEKTNWGSCHSLSIFMKAVAMANNIVAVDLTYPKELITMADHNFIDFPSLELTLLHSDNPYSSAYNYAPVEEIFISKNVREDFFTAFEKREYFADKLARLHAVKTLTAYPDRAALQAFCLGKDSYQDFLLKRFRCRGCYDLSSHKEALENFLETLEFKSCD